MKWTKILIALIGLTACNNQADTLKNTFSDKDSIKTNQKGSNSEKELVLFLDSIGRLNPEDIITDMTTYIVDSTLKNQTQLNNKVSANDFNALQKIAKSGNINVDLAKRIFPELEIEKSLLESLENNLLPIAFYSFDKNQKDFNEFAISIGYDDGVVNENDVYFFKRDKVIAKHKIYHRYGLELKHFKNELTETTIYYKVNYGSGIGIWWHQFNFYCYVNDELIPTLTEIKSINHQFWSWTYLIESTIISTNPLKLKFEFYNVLADSVGNEIELINDSTQITYNFDINKKMYEPQFSDSKLNKFKLLTYYFYGNPRLLFINVNNELFKKSLKSNDQQKRQAIFYHLNEMKNELEGNRKNQD